MHCSNGRLQTLPVSTLLLLAVLSCSAACSKGFLSSKMDEESELKSLGGAGDSCSRVNAMAAPALNGFRPSKVLRLLEGKSGHKRFWTLMKSRAALQIRHIEQIMSLLLENGDKGASDERS